MPCSIDSWEQVPWVLGQTCYITGQILIFLGLSCTFLAHCACFKEKSREIFGVYWLFSYLCTGLMVARERGTSLLRAVYRRFESYPIYLEAAMPLFYLSELWTFHLRCFYNSYWFQQVVCPASVFEVRMYNDLYNFPFCSGACSTKWSQESRAQTTPSPSWLRRGRNCFCGMTH